MVNISYHTHPQEVGLTNDLHANADEERERGRRRQHIEGERRKVHVLFGGDEGHMYCGLIVSAVILTERPGPFPCIAVC